MTARIAPQLLERLQADPHTRFALILRVKGMPADLVSELTARGAQVRRIFTLVPGVAVTMTGQDCLALLNFPWLQSVEEDRECRIL